MKKFILLPLLLFIYTQNLHAQCPDFPEAEICDGIDNDCDGVIDNGTLQTFYRDYDEDGFGNDGTVALKDSILACFAPPGYVDNDFDCNDFCFECFPPFNGAPGGVEVCDGFDNDCDGLIDEGLLNYFYYIDGDGDGYGGSPVFPDSICQVIPTGFYTLISGDCDDSDFFINPGAPELCDGLDNNCDGAIDEGTLMIWGPDVDGDGFGTSLGAIIATCQPIGFVNNFDDCNDNCATCYPGAPELCDGLDNDCNGLIDDGLLQQTFYQDFDGDGFGGSGTVGLQMTVQACSAPPGYVDNELDCNDICADCFPPFNGAPGGVEVCDGLDNDCDGLVDEGLVYYLYYLDFDGDGYGGDYVNFPDTFCQLFPPGSFFTLLSGDCDDGNSSVNPGAIDIPGDGIDNDCDGIDNCADDDADGICNEDDICPNGDDSLDTNANGVPDACEGNDICSVSIPIDCNSLTPGTNMASTGATDESPNPGNCNGVNQGNQGVWYSISGTGDIITLSTCQYGGSANFKTRIKIFSGDCSTLICVTAEKDNCGDQTTVSFLSTLGESYFILLEGKGNEEGEFILAVSCLDFVNDDCSDATVVTCNSIINGNNEFASDDDAVAPSCNGVNDENQGVWYKFIGTGGIITASTCENGGSANFKTRIKIYSGTCGNLDCEAAEKDNCGDQTTVSFLSILGTEYYILVEGKGSNSGSFQLSISCIPFTNDICDDALPVSCNSVTTGNNIFATDDDAVAPSCNGVNDENRGVWYSLLGTGGSIVISTCINGGNANFKTRIKVYSGTCGNLICVTAAKDNCGDQTTVSFSSDLGEEYFVLVEGKGKQSGTFNLSVDCAPILPVESNEIVQMEFSKVNHVYNANEEGLVFENKSMSQVNNFEFTVYPNPNSGDILIVESELPSSSTNSGIIRVMDIQGKTLLDKRFENATNQLKYSLNLNGFLNSGMYLISLSIDDRTSFSKFVIE